MVGFYGGLNCVFDKKTGVFRLLFFEICPVIDAFCEKTLMDFCV